MVMFILYYLYSNIIYQKIIHILGSAIIKDIGFRRFLITQIKNVLLQLMLMEEYLVMEHQ